MKVIRNTVLAIIVVALLAFENVSEVKKASYDAYLSGSANLWETAVVKARINHDKNPSNETMFQWALAEYGLLNSTMRDQNEDLFDEYIKEAIEKFESLSEEQFREADCKALLSALTGLKIAYSPWKGMFLGPKSASLITEALAIDPDSPIVQQLYGNQQNFTPEMWGGNPANAIEAYRKAINLYEVKDEKENWMYLDTHAWLGIMYKKEGRDDDALEIWNKVVEHEPDFNWVKKNLIPSIETSGN